MMVAGLAITESGNYVVFFQTAWLFHTLPLHKILALWHRHLRITN